MNLELYMVFFNNSAKKVHVFMNGITEFWSHYHYMITLKKLQAFYLEISFYLVYKTRTFLLSACQKPLQVGSTAKIRKMAKGWK